jgi:hypothetical protein
MKYVELVEKSLEEKFALNPTSTLNKKFKMLVKKVFAKNNNNFKVNEKAKVELTKDDIKEFQRLKLLQKKGDTIKVTPKGIGFSLGMKIDSKDDANVFTKKEIKAHVEKKKQEKVDYDREIFTGWIQAGANGMETIDSWDGMLNRYKK